MRKNVAIKKVNLDPKCGFKCDLLFLLSYLFITLILDKYSVTCINIIWPNETNYNYYCAKDPDLITNYF